MQRSSFLKQIETQMKVHPVCGVLGPRQAGKTTLAHQYAENYAIKPLHIFDYNFNNKISVEELQSVVG